VQILHAKIPKAQKDSQVISVFLCFWDLWAQKLFIPTSVKLTPSVVETTSCHFWCQFHRFSDVSFDNPLHNNYNNIKHVLLIIGKDKVIIDENKTALLSISILIKFSNICYLHTHKKSLICQFSLIRKLNVLFACTISFGTLLSFWQ